MKEHEYQFETDEELSEYFDDMLAFVLLADEDSFFVGGNTSCLN